MDAETFFETHAVDGELSDTDMAKFLTGDFGDTSEARPEEEIGATPEPDTDTESDEIPEGDGKQEEQGEYEPETPVVLAKNGKDVIPYEKLVEAREEAKAAKEAQQALMQEMESIKAMLADKQSQGEKVPEQDELSELKEQLSDLPELVAYIEKYSESHQKQVAALVEQVEQLKGQIDPVIKTTEKNLVDAHFSAINSAHKDAEAIVESKEFAEWKDKQPSFVKDAYDNVLARGTAAQVIELFTSFKDATGYGKPQDATVDKVVPKKEKVSTPKSLSDIPAGTAVPHDEAEALMQMSDVALMQKFAGKSQAEIDALIRRIV